MACFESHTTARWLGGFSFDLGGAAERGGGRASGDLVGLETQARQYGVVSLVPDVNEQSLRKAPADYPAEIVEQYLQLPDDVPQRVLDLARDVTASAPTLYDKALALQTFLRQFDYSLNLDPPPPRSLTKKLPGEKIWAGVGLLLAGVLLSWVWERWLRLDRMSGPALMAAIYRRLARHGSRFGVPRLPSDTPGEYGHRLALAVARRAEQLGKSSYTSCSVGQVARFGKSSYTGRSVGQVA